MDSELKSPTTPRESTPRQKSTTNSATSSPQKRSGRKPHRSPRKKKQSSNSGTKPTYVTPGTKSTPSTNTTKATQKQKKGKPKSPKSLNYPKSSPKSIAKSGEDKNDSEFSRPPSIISSPSDHHSLSSMMRNLQLSAQEKALSPQNSAENWSLKSSNSVISGGLTIAPYDPTKDVDKGFWIRNYFGECCDIMGQTLNRIFKKKLNIDSFDDLVDFGGIFSFTMVPYVRQYFN